MLNDINTFVSMSTPFINSFIKITENLKKEQERVIKDMEMTIQRRDYIKLRYPLDDKNFVSSSNAYNNRENFKNLYNRGNEKVVNSKMKKI